MVICVCIVYSYFCTTIKELEGTVWPAKLKIFPTWPFTEKVCLFGSFKDYLGSSNLSRKQPSRKQEKGIQLAVTVVKGSY